MKVARWEPQDSLIQAAYNKLQRAGSDEKSQPNSDRARETECRLLLGVVAFNQFT